MSPPAPALFVFAHKYAKGIRLYGDLVYGDREMLLLDVLCGGKGGRYGGCG